MPTQTHPFLRITGGVSTITILDGSGGDTNYRLVRGGWAPSIAGLRRSLLGGIGSYDDVVEEWEINIYGATAAEAMANLGILAITLDRAERWWRGDAGLTPPIVEFAPQGSTTASTAAPYKAAILGRAEGDETPLNTSPEALDVGMTYVIRNVRVRFVRRGLWLHSEEAGSSSGAASSGVMTSNFSGGSHNKPLTVIDAVLTGFSATCNALSNAYLLFGDVNALNVINAESLTASGFTSVADSANAARNTNVLRYTPSSTSTATSGSTSVSLPSTRRIAVYATLRSNVANKVWKITPRVYCNGQPVAGETFIFEPGSTTTPQAVYLGEVALPVTNISTLTVDVQVSVDSTTSSPTLDIDSIFVQSVQDETSTALFIPSASVASANLRIRHQLLADRVPVIDLGSSTSRPVGYAGQALLCHDDSTHAAILIAPVGSKWVLTNAAGAAETTTLTSTRRKAYLIAE